MAELCCLVEHDPRPFSVSIPPTGTIYDLKELISRVGSKALSQCPAADLVLTKVNVDLEASKSDISAGDFEPNANDVGVRLLDDPTEAISEIWSTKPTSGYAHVFVGLPTSTVLGKRTHDLNSVQDSKHIEAMRSQTGKLPKLPTEKILDDRPEPDSVPPVSLLYDGFGYFMDAFRSREHASSVGTRWRDLELAVNDFADEMAGFYCDDASRSGGGLRALNVILALGDGKKFRAVDISTAHSDSDYDQPYDTTTCPIWFKNEAVDLNSMPVSDLAAYAARSRDILMQHSEGVERGWRTPLLGLSVIGPSVTFYAIIFLQQWRIVSLTPTLSCIASACEGDDRKSLYAAFAGALTLLRRIDEDATHFISAPPTIQHADPTFPYISALPKYGAPDEKVQFQILRPHPDNRLMYIAQTLGEQQILVKFTRSYSIALHAFCAGRGHAPGILGFGKIPGGWYVVAMDYMLSATHPSRSPNLARLCNKWIDELQRLVQSFHDEGLVHGDLRESNILCDGETVMLIDFDWGGAVGEASYPFVRLSSELTSGQDSIDRKITKDDDRRVLHNTLEQLESKMRLL